MKVLLKTLSFLLLLSGLLFAQEQHPTGAKPPSPEEQYQIDYVRPKIVLVRPNALANSRINEERAAKGLAPLSMSPSAATQPEYETIAGRLSAIPESMKVKMAGAAGVGSNPVSVDNSLLVSFPPIGNQGGLGSCACFSTIYYLMSHETALANNWNIKSGDSSRIFSPRWIYNFMDSGLVMGGSSDDTNLHYVATQGCATWADYPYDGVDYLKWCLNPLIQLRALNNRMTEPATISNVVDDSNSLDTLKGWLANGHVVTFDTGVNGWSNVITVAGKPIVPYSKDSGGGHSMTLVGYDDNVWVDVNSNGITDVGEMGIFKIANSWGAGDGVGGFRFIAYDAVRTSSTLYTNSDRIPGIFWGETVYCSTAVVGYKPKLLAKVTLSSAARNEIGLRLGASLDTATTPSTVIQSFLQYSGGAYCFDGTTAVSNQPMEGSFYVDMTRMLPATPEAMKYYIGFTDFTANNPTILNEYVLQNCTYGGQFTATDLPKTLDNSGWNGYYYSPISLAYGVFKAGNDPSVYNSQISWPSPFNPATGGTYKMGNIPLDCVVTISAADGKVVRTLREVDMMPANNNSITWDGKNSAGDVVGRGIYIYHIIDGNGNFKTGKIAVVK